jgi:hypothetical protein
MIMHDLQITLLEEGSHESEGKPPTLVLCNGTLIVNILFFWPLIFVPIDFMLYALFEMGNANHDDVNGVTQTPTVSLTGSYLPASPIFTYGFHLEAILVVFACISLYLAVDCRLKSLNIPDTSVPPTKPMELSPFFRVIEYFICKPCVDFNFGNKEFTVEQLKRSNQIALVLGLLAAFCLSMVASISLTIDEKAHTTFAGFMFGFGVLHIVIFYFRLFRYLQFSDQEVHRLIPRLLLCLFIAIPCNLLILFIVGMIHLSCDSTMCLQVAANLGVTMEYIFMIALLIYFQSFSKFLEDIILVEMVKKVE